MCSFRTYARFLFSLLISQNIPGPLLAESTSVATSDQQARASSLMLKRSQFVKGTLVMSTGDQDKSQTAIRIPDAEITLKDPTSLSVAALSLTGLDGRFAIRAPSPGTYLLCWTVKDLTTGCKRQVIVDDQTVYLGRILIRPETNYFHGKALQKDNIPCWLSDPFFKLDVSTTVVVLDHKGQQVGAGVRANVSGEYVIPAVSGQRYKLRAKCEQSATTSAKWWSSAANPRVDLPLDNDIPVVAELAAFRGGRGITRAGAGDKVTTRFTATDNDDDSLEYLWRVLDGSGTIASANPSGSWQKWTLPTTSGIHQLFVMARDGKGGYAYKRLYLQVGVPALDFSGQVIDEISRAPVAGAEVNINGVKATTNHQGWFAASVTPIAEERYVLNVSSRDHASLSRIYDKASTGNTYELIRTQITSHDPTKPITVVDQESSGLCGPHVNVDQAEQAGKYDKPHLDRCNTQGVRLELPANALIREDNGPPKPPVRLSLASLNPARRALPGDYRASDRNGPAVELTSFGAAYVAVRDASDRLLNLKPGTQAILSMPIPLEQAQNAKPGIPIWSYNEKSGYWEEDGEAALTQTPHGPMYIGTTEHFSTINLGLAGSDPANATCVRLELDASLSSWNKLVLRAYVPVGATAIQTKEFALNNDQYHAIHRIPYSNPPVPNTLRLELRGELPTGEQVVLLNDVINTDARPKMIGNDLWPDYPYSECGDPIVLTGDSATLPDYGAINAAGKPAFLTGSYGPHLPVNGEQLATLYYDTIDPNSTKDKLGKWWGENGFDPTNGSGGVRTSYLNHNHLGFGRDMHCLENRKDLACYVTHYGLPDQNPSNADDAASGNPAKRGATVAMEYNAGAGDTAVSFYVFNGGDADATRIKFADLDGLGPKPIPHLCLVCHGGDFIDDPDDPNDKNVAGAKFRELDLPSFRYSGNRSWDFAPAPNTLTSAELTAFASLNQMVANSNAGNKIARVINAWYQGGGNTPARPAAPLGWVDDPGTPAIDEEEMYHELYGPTCRTCHIARSGIIDSYDNFKSSSYSVCSSSKIMPNAYITYKDFWQDPVRIDLYKTATSAATCE